jgi:hypothetical protein
MKKDKVIVPDDNIQTEADKSQMSLSSQQLVTAQGSVFRSHILQQTTLKRDRVPVLRAVARWSLENGFGRMT